jgi:hypothetical protein
MRIAQHRETKRWRRPSFFTIKQFSALSVLGSFVVTAILVSGLPAGASEWSGEFALPKVATNSTCQGGVPNNMTVLTNGRVYLVFKETTNSIGRFKFAWSDDHGTNWAAPLPFNPQPAAPPSGLPSLAADATDRLHFCWSSGTSIHYAGLDPATHVFSEYTLITNAGKNIAFNQITADRSNRLHVIWHTGNAESSSDTAEVWYAQRPAGATNFNAPVMLSQDDGFHSAFPSADCSGASGELLAVAWRDTTANPYTAGSDWNIKCRVSTNAGASWNAELTLASGAHRQFDPLLVVDRNDVIHVAFHAYPAPPAAPNSNYISLAFSTDAGLTWQNAYGTNGFARLSPTDENHSLCKAAYDYAHDIVWYFWKKRVGSAEDLVGVGVFRRGQHVSAIENLTDLAGGAAAFHNFAVGPDGRLRAHYNRSTVTPANPFDQATIFYRERNLPAALTPTITHLALTSAAATITWPSEFAVNYTVQTSTNLTDWSAAPGLHTGTGDPLTATATNDTAAAQFFLRLRAER